MLARFLIGNCADIDRDKIAAVGLFGGVEIIPFDTGKQLLSIE